MDNLLAAHVNRIKIAVLKKHSAESVARWICENTFYAGTNYSYTDHEYQEKVVGDTSQDKNVQKCSQVGMSEAEVREALALVNVLSPYTVCYTLPTGKFAVKFVKTRVNSVIEGSRVMKENVNGSNNNTEVKQFGDSFIYFNGAASSNAPISIPVDHLIHDEVDFSDQEVLGQYQSRLTHSKFKRITKLSTPTLPDFGINRAFKASRRNHMMCQCHHCNHWFVPDYYQHVKIPGFLGDLREVSKAVLAKIRWMEAAVRCPKCGEVPSLQPDQRSWVCENPDENHKATGFQVSPFDAPNIITPAYLVEASTKYDRIQDFVNFNLGLPAEDSEATLSDDDFEGVFNDSDSGNGTVHVMGVDVGNIYHMTVGAVDSYGDVHSVLSEQVPMSKARARYAELRRQFNPVCSVIDSGPHAETVMALQETDPNLYASVYMKSRSIVTHNVVEREGSDEEGKSFIRQVNVNRSKAFDGYMEFLRSGHLSIKESAEKETIINHHKSMKRVKTYDPESGELVYTWQKSDGQDHYHHSHLYMWIASKIRGVGRSAIVLPTMMPMKFRLRSQ